MTGPEINDVDERLLWLLRRAGDEWGPTGVAEAAARLVESGPTLYINHDRTEPAPGDVVRQEDGSPHASGHTWHYLGDEGRECLWWRFDNTRIPFDKGARLRLLVDGETGEVVR